MTDIKNLENICSKIVTKFNLVLEEETEGLTNQMIAKVITLITSSFIEKVFFFDKVLSTDREKTLKLLKHYLFTVISDMEKKYEIPL